MRILFITTCYPSKELPQYCVFLEQQAQALTKKGIKTDVLLICEGEKDTYEKITYNGINITKIGISKGSKKDVLLPTNMTKKDAKKIENVICDNYDAVSVHFGGLKILRSLIKICSKKRLKLVLHFHGLNVWHEFYEKRKWLYDYFRLQKKHIYPKIDAMVGVSEKVTARFSEKITNVPAYTVYNGVNLDLFKFKERTFKKSEKFRVLTVANLIELKGHDYLIKAVAKAREQGMDMELTIAGRGPLEEELRALSEDLGVSDCVKFIGYIEYDKIAELMQENDIFVMPSYYEALGCVYLEAMSSGMITIGVKGQGIDEVIEDGENGYLVNPESIDDIVWVFQKINVETAEKLKEISKSASETAQEYSWEKSADSLCRVYKNLEE